MWNVGICGDSWMSPIDNEYKNTHFSELFTNHYNFKLNQYSRTGSSNGGICLQIEQAIQDKCDLILVGTTTCNRIEYSMEDIYETEDVNKDIYLYNTQNKITLYNVAKPSKHVDELLASNKISPNFRLGHQPLTQLLLQKEPFVYMNKQIGKLKDEDEIENRFNAFKTYFTYIFHPQWKKQLDQYCIYAVMHKLHESKIPYVFVFDFLGMEKNEWLPRPLITNIGLEGWHYPNPDPGFHTSLDDQKTIYKLLVEHLKKTEII